MLSWGIVPERFWTLLQPRAEAAFFTVTTTADNGNNAAPTPGSLRQAIINANATAALDFIKFNIGSGLKTIKPPTPLPTITQPIYIDGTTQPGWSGPPLIEIDGSLAGANAKGLYITGGGSTVRYIVVNRFSSDGIALATGSNNTIIGCFIGTDSSGASDQGNGGNGISILSSSSNNAIGGISNLRNVISGNTGAGIYISSGANGNKIRRNFIGTNDGGTAAIGNSGYGININNSANNIIGGTANAANINVISGNQRGILITGVGANGNLIQNNYIGTNFDATADLGNVEGGIDLYGSGNTVGGTVVAARNIISGNGTNGIYIGGVGNLIKGNYIGTNKAGTAAIANGSFGIRMIDAFNNTIGGTTPEERNLISGNVRGLSLEGNTFANTVLGNYIGTNFDGTAALGNTNGAGIALNAPSNTIGGLAAGAGNLISGNASGGITMSAAAEDNKIQGNLIGTDKAGTAAIPNGSYGIRMIGSNHNLIGGTVSSGRNIVSGNGRGISIEGGGGTDNTITGNYIGVDINGTADLGNNGSGIEISGPANVIGGTAAGEGNVISGNSSNGIAITNGAGFNLVRGNLIGTNKDGTAAIPNGSYGIRMIGVSNNTIGGTAAGARNLISGNVRGMSIEGTSSTGNKVQGNLIGTNFNGNAALGNSGSGIEVGGVSNLIGGDVAGARNIISGNLQGGIVISGSDVTDNKVQGNYIGTDINGNTDVGNGSYGIRMINAHDNLIGGTTAGAGNVISGNERGMSIEGASATGNKVQGNRIGTNAAGTAVLGNDGSGVELGGPNNQVGGSTAQERNIISGNKQGGVVFSGAIATGNKVQGNYIGPDVSGNGDLGNSSYGIRVYDAPANLIGGTAAGEGNVISGNERGISLEQDGGTDNVVQGNFIGTNAAGTAGLGNDGSAVEIFSANNLIGGTTAGARNVISANKQGGIVIRGNKATGNKIQGNYIGTKADGVSPLPNTFLGVQTSEAFNNLIGGTTAGAGNIIASNSFHGVFIDSGHGNSVLGNSIFNNVRQGIDLAPYGVDINDAGDADNGPNKKQNYPILSSVTVVGATTVINGSLNSTPNTQFRIEFFSNPACDPSGFGEGKTFIGFKTVTTNAAGDALINVTLPMAAPDNYVTATATSNASNTSEFSPCALVGGPNPGTFQFSQDYYIAQENEPNMVITVTRSGGTSGTVSVDYETVPDSATSPADYTHAAGTLVFNDGEVVKTFTVPIAYDTLDEGNQEQLFLKLANATGGATIGAQNNVILYIIDYDLTFPTTYVSDVQIVEGNAGTTNAVFTITMSPHSQTVSVGYNTADGTATAGSDYTAKSGTVVFTPAQTTKTISVPIIGDTANEDDELFYFKINAVNTGSVSDAVGDGLIINDDGTSGLQLSSATYNVSEGVANAIITVNRTGSSGGTVTVNYATSNGTATAPADYTTKTGTLTFGNGVTSQTFNIPIVNDPVDEPNETINVTLSNPTNATLGAQQTAVVTIADNDAPPNITVNNATVTEGNAGTANAAFTVSLSAPSSATVTVKYATADGTATSPADYAAQTNTLTFAPGETSKPVNITIKGDVIDEPDESFKLNLSNATNALISDNQGDGVITDDEATPKLSVNDIEVTEGNAGAVNTASFKVSLSGASSATVTVKYATVNSSAVAPGDYTAETNTLTFAPGETSKSVSVDVIGDNLDETDETFTLNLSNATNALIDDGVGAGKIKDNDAQPSISIDDATVNEGNSGTTDAVFTVSLSTPSAFTVTVNYTTANGTAVAPGDYAVKTGTVTFNPGDVSETVSVQVKGDTLDEANEGFTLNLSNATNATIGDGAGAGTIKDNDATPTLSINDVTVTEGNSGTTDAVFTVSLSAASGQDVAVDYDTANGTATASTDYLSSSNVLVIPAGQTSKTITVKVKGDTTPEADESFAVNLSNASTATIQDGAGQGIILDEDTPDLQFSKSSYSVAEGAGSINITVTRTGGNLATASSVDYTTQDATAFQKADFNIALGTVKFAAGESTKSFSIFITNDAYVEGSESFSLLLSNPTGANLGATQMAVVTINDNDNQNTNANPIDSVDFFVRQHYVDFLNREPEPSGLAAWSAILNNCAPGDTSCDRINVSSAFFRSPEFYDRGYFIYRFYETALGDKPEYLDFMAGLRRVTGFLTPQQLEENKVQFVSDFMNRQEFKNKYDPITTAAGFVDTLAQTAGVTLPNRNALVQALDTNQKTRAEVLREVAESQEVSAKFYNKAFVVMQYFGYLRRDPDALYVNWLNTLNQTGDYRQMVNGFMNSAEYRQRFNH
jgi:hypothetical protein